MAIKAVIGETITNTNKYVGGETDTIIVEVNERTKEILANIKDEFINTIQPLIAHLLLVDREGNLLTEEELKTLTDSDCNNILYQNNIYLLTNKTGSNLLYGNFAVEDENPQNELFRFILVNTITRKYEVFTYHIATDEEIQKEKERATGEEQRIENKFDDIIDALDLAQVGSDGNYIKFVSQSDGQVTAVEQPFDTDFENASNDNAATTLAVKTYVDDADENLSGRISNIESSYVSAIYVSAEPHDPKTGSVALSKSDILLGRVQNTGDAADYSGNNAAGSDKKFTAAGAYNFYQEAYAENLYIQNELDQIGQQIGYQRKSDDGQYIIHTKYLKTVVRKALQNYFPNRYYIKDQNDEYILATEAEIDAYPEGTQFYIRIDDFNYEYEITPGGYIKQTKDLADSNKSRLDIIENIDTGLQVTNNGAIISDDLTVNGDLVVKGTTTTVDQETIQSKANILVTNSDNGELVGYTGIDYIEARADLDNNRDARLAVAKKVAQLDNDKGTHLDYQPGANREGDFSADYYSVGKLVQRDDKVNKTTDFRTILFYPTIGSKPRVCYWFKLTIKGQEWPNFKQIGRDQLVQLVLSTAEKLDKKSNRWNMEKLKRKVLDEIAKDEQTISAVEFDQEDNLETRSKLDKGGVIAKPRVRALYSNQIYYLSTKNVTYGAPVVKYIKEDLDQDLEEKRETKRYYIRPQNIFCANKKDVLKALIDVADAGENCTVYTLKNLDDHDDVQKLSNDDIIYTYDEHALRDKNGVLVMDYDLFIKHEEERPKLGKSPDQITKSEFDQNYDDRMTQNTFVESKEDNMEDLVGKKVTIISIDPNDPAADDYAGKEGTITEVGKDPWGDIYYRGTWGGIALYPNIDKLKITEGFEVKYEDPFNLSFDTYEGDRKLFEDANEEQICCICGEPYKGYGNNAEPYKHGYCCDECNLKFVIPARMQGLNSYYDKKDEDEE